MKITESFWEERNLGVKSYEITLDEKDCLDDFFTKELDLIKDGTRYLVVKAPVAEKDMLFKLPEAGYVFMETSFSLSLKRENYSCPAFLAKFDRNVDVLTVDHNDQFQRIYSEIEKGVFETDRIALDINFTQTIANTRYVNWIKDLVEHGSILHEVVVRGRPIGFFIVHELTPQKARGILTGLYKEYNSSGLGALVMKKLYDSVWQKEYCTYYATVVSNNLKALRSNLMFGSEVDSLYYHYVKHVST
jgi:hypothetical protein